MTSKALKTEWSEAYLCYLEGEIVYIGSGKLNRHKHCNSGTSHVYELNKLHFEGVVFDVKVQKYESRKTADEKERELIKLHLPKYNTVYTPKHSSKGDHLEKYRNFREIFKSKYLEHSYLDFTKMYNLLDEFLKCHSLEVIESEGVIFRGRGFYFTRGCGKLTTLVRNHRRKPTKPSTGFFTLLKDSLEAFYGKTFCFKYMTGLDVYDFHI